MRPARLRTIVEELKFYAELNNLVKLKIPRIEEFVEGVKWLLARRPEEGKQIGNTVVWFIANEFLPQKGELPVVIYYTFDEHTVNLLSIVETIYPPKNE
jgi:hypothetical protein